VVVIVFEGVGSTDEEGGGSSRVVGGGFVVGCVCWRRTTMIDGTRVCCSLAVDLNVRTLGGTRCGAPCFWRGAFCNRWQVFPGCSTVGGTRREFEVGGAEGIEET